MRGSVRLPDWAMVVLLAALAMFGPFSIDTMFPAFPQMQDDLRVSAAAIQQTVSVYMLAYGCMALWHGPLSDAWGRKPVVLAGVAVYSGASIGCALASSLDQLLLMRALQGISAGSGLIVGRAMIRDCFEGPRAQQVMSQVTMVFGLAPAVAPMVGGWVIHYRPWPWIFCGLAVWGGLLCLACWRWLPETHPAHARTPLAAGILLRGYARMLADPPNSWLIASASCNFAALFIVIASAPFVVLDLLHLDASGFGYLFVPIVAGLMLGAWWSGRLAGRASTAQVIRLGYGVMLGAGAINVVYCLVAPQVALPWAVLPVLAHGVGMSLAFPTLTLVMLDRYPRQRGAAASLQSFGSLMLSTVVAGVLSPWLIHSALALALTSLAFVVVGVWCWRRVAPMLVLEASSPVALAEPLRPA